MGSLVVNAASVIGTFNPIAALRLSEDRASVPPRSALVEQRPLFVIGLGFCPVPQTPERGLRLLQGGHQAG